MKVKLTKSQIFLTQVMLEDKMQEIKKKKRKVSKSILKKLGKALA